MKFDNDKKIMKMLKKIIFVAILVFLLPGCRWSMIQDSDSGLAIAGKVTSRIILGISTLGFFELGVMEVKNMDSWLGCSESELINSWGMPSRRYYCYDGTVALSYITVIKVTTPGHANSTTYYNGYNTFTTNTTYTPPQTNTSTVIKTFYVRNGTIVRWDMPVGYFTLDQHGSL